MSSATVPNNPHMRVLRTRADFHAAGSASPLSVALGYLQVAEPLSEDAAWFSLLAERVCAQYLGHVEEERARLRIEARAAAKVGV